MAFTFSEVFDAIRICTENDIKVLGVEVFEVREHEYYTNTMSDFEFEMEGWEEFLAKNNSCAEDFTRSHPSGDEHFYLLTTVSHREFRQIQKLKST